MLYRAFHTTAESRLEHQPYISVSGKVITWDGRLDNRDELVSQLGDVVKEDCTDVAIVASAFERWGTGSFAKLTGDWALAIWDPHDQELTLARDYIGVKLLFYQLRGSRVSWCNHLVPLVLSGESLTLCEEYIAAFLASRLQGHLTPYREIHSVPPGKFVRIRNGNPSVHAYWKFDPRLEIRYKTDAEYEEHFRHLFRQAVRRRLRSPWPILAELSGGYDSSSIVCMSDDILAKEGAETPSLDTFSYSYLDEPDADDCLYFTKVEEKRSRIGHHVEIRGSGNTFSIESPMFRAFPHYGGRREVEVARSNVVKNGKYRVTLSGNGGDEFMGQALYPVVVLADFLQHLRVREFTTSLAAWSLLKRRPLIQLLFQTLLLLMPTSVRSKIAPEAKLQPWLNRDFAKRQNLSALLLEPAAEGSWFWPPRSRNSLQMRAIWSGTLTNFPPTADETRYPYFDQTLTEFLMSIPGDQLLRPGDRRSLMRRALSGILPTEILSRRTKQLEIRCYIVTFEAHWEALKDILNSPLSSALGYIRQTDFHAALMAAKAGQLPIHSMLLLRALFLELWLRQAATLNVISFPAEVHKLLSPTSSSEKAPAFSLS
jgi:asparagine synthase (glutamine-hydrolysing)